MVFFLQKRKQLLRLTIRANPSEPKSCRNQPEHAWVPGSVKPSDTKLGFWHQVKPSDMKVTQSDTECHRVTPSDTEWHVTQSSSVPNWSQMSQCNTKWTQIDAKCVLSRVMRNHDSKRKPLSLLSLNHSLCIKTHLKSKARLAHFRLLSEQNTVEYVRMRMKTKTRDTL